LSHFIAHPVYTDRVCTRTVSNYFGTDSSVATV